MKKKIVSLLLAVVMTASLAACGTKQVEEQPKATEESATTEAEAETEAVAETDWPKKTINIISVFSAGGDSDYNARLFAEKLTDILGVTCVVTNVTGNGGATGEQQAYDSAADGYTVMLNHEAIYVSNAIGAIDFNLQDGFDLSCIVGKNAGNAICVAADSKYQTLEDLVNASLEDGSNVTFAANVGATTQVMGTMMNAVGAKFNLVDMGNTSERLAALLGGQCDAIPNAVGTVQQYIDSGDMRALCILEDERNEACPDVPTAKELGYDASFPLYYYFAFPKGTDPQIVEKFADACEEVYQMEDVQKAQYEAYSQQPFFMKGEEMIAFEEERAASVASLKDLLNQ